MIPYSPETIAALRSHFDFDFRTADGAEVDVGAVTCELCALTKFFRFDDTLYDLLGMLVSHLQAHRDRLPLSVAVKGPPPEGLR